MGEEGGQLQPTTIPDDSCDTRTDRVDKVRPLSCGVRKADAPVCVETLPIVASVGKFRTGRSFRTNLGQVKATFSFTLFLHRCVAGRRRTALSANTTLANTNADESVQLNLSRCCPTLISSVQLLVMLLFFLLS